MAKEYPVPNVGVPVLSWSGGRAWKAFVLDDIDGRCRFTGGWSSSSSSLSVKSITSDAGLLFEREADADVFDGARDSSLEFRSGVLTLLGVGANGWYSLLIGCVVGFSMISSTSSLSPSSDGVGLPFLLPFAIGVSDPLPKCQLPSGSIVTSSALFEVDLRMSCM